MPPIALLLGLSFVSAQESIPVPGGKQAIVRLLGPIEEVNGDFILGLNRVLLTQTRRDHEWRDVESRVELVEYLRNLDRLTRKFSSTIRIGLADKTLRKSFDALGAELGYRLRFKDGEFEVLPQEGVDAERRRRLAGALGWDLAVIGESLVDGGETTLQVSTDFVSNPVPFPGEWPTTLEEFAQDQRLGLLLEGRRRLSAETTSFMDEVDWTWLYTNASVTFFSYARSLRLEDGQLVIPGGIESAAAWSDILGTSPDRPADFIRDLLTRNNARGAYLWDSLSWVPEEVARFYLGTGNSKTAAERRFAKRLYKRLDATTHLDFDWPRGGDLGFGTLARSLRLLPDQAGMDLPGGPGLWFTAIRGADSPRTPDALEKLVRRGQANTLEESEFLLKLLTEDIKVEGLTHPVLPRLIRAANMFRDQRELLTPANVILLARSSDRYPAALPVLEDLVLVDPESIRDYLMAVAHLDALDSSVESELLVENFQGGVEWLRVMAAAGRVPPAVLEGSLREWARLHLEVSDPFSAAPGQLEWFVALLRKLRKLPAADESAAGRGPFERAFIAAMVGPRDPQRFGWGGLDYGGRRSGDLARAMAGNLVIQEIPSVDRIVSLHAEFESLAEACSASEVDDAHAHVEALLAILDSMPGTDLQPSSEDKELWSRIFPVDRTRVRAILEGILKQRKPKGLARKADDVARAERLMAREIRPFLLAPAYLQAMGDEDNILFETPRLVRSHMLQRRLDLEGAFEDPWTDTTVGSSEHPEFGSHVLGHLGGVSKALARFSRAMTGGARTLTHRVWFEDLRHTRWHTLDPSTSRVVYTLIQAGRDVAAGDLDLVRTKVPRARLESNSLVSPSELFAIGLETPAGETVGEDWRGLLDHVGISVSNLDWAPYESLEHEIKPLALIERQLLDIKLAVIEYLGRHRLPGAVGADLAGHVLRDFTAETSLDPFRNWEAHLRWVNRLDEDYFDERMRTCLLDGLYSARGF